MFEVAGGIILAVLFFAFLPYIIVWTIRLIAIALLMIPVGLIVLMFATESWRGSLVVTVGLLLGFGGILWLSSLPSSEKVSRKTT